MHDAADYNDEADQDSRSAIGAVDLMK